MTVASEPIKAEFHATYTKEMLNGIDLALFYVTLGLPIAGWVDRGNRKLIRVRSSVLAAASGVRTPYV